MSIEFNNAIYHYGNDDLLYHYDLSLDPNIIYVLHGESGIGKTTFFDVLAGYLPLKSGTISIDGSAINELTVAQRPINYLFQSNNLFEHLTAFDNAALVVEQNLKLNTEQIEKVDAMLDNCGVLEQRNQRPNTLSGGQSQRVALSRAFLRDRPILLLDEPFNGLDRSNIDAIIALISAHTQQLNHHCLIISHELQHFDGVAHQLLTFDELDDGVWLNKSA